MPGAGVGVADLSRLLIFSEMPFFSSSDWAVSHESSALAHRGSRVLTTPPLHTAHTTPPCPLCSRVRRYGPAAWSHLGRTHLGNQIMMLAEDGRHARRRAPEAVHVLRGRGRRHRLGRRHLGEHQAQASEQVHGSDDGVTTKTARSTGAADTSQKNCSGGVIPADVSRGRRARMTRVSK